MGMKIWAQSMGALGALPTYEAAVTAQAEKILPEGTEIDFHGTDLRTFSGSAPIEVLTYPWAFYMTSIQIVESALRAQEEGYDAVLLTSYGDPGLRVMRSMVDIPVASLFETSLIFAQSTSLSPALFSLTPDHARLTARMVDEAGYGDNILRVYSMPNPITEVELNEAASGGGAWLADFEAVSRQAIEDGADLLIPSEGMINALIASAGLTEVDGVPIQDSFAAVLCYVEMLVKLNRLSGNGISRRHGMGRPGEEAIEGARKVAAELLSRPRGGASA